MADCGWRVRGLGSGGRALAAPRQARRAVVLGVTSHCIGRAQHFRRVSPRKDEPSRVTCRGVRWYTQAEGCGRCVSLLCQQCPTMGSTTQHRLQSIGAPLCTAASGAADPSMAPSVRRIEQSQGDQPAKQEGATAECTISAWSPTVCCGRLPVRPAVTGKSPMISSAPEMPIARALVDSSIPRKLKFAGSSTSRWLPVALVKFSGH